MRACVTGATGMIGAALVRRLLAAGAEVQALVRSPDKARALANAGVQITNGEITNANALTEAMRSADVVFHLAAMVNSSAPLSAFLEPTSSAPNTFLKLQCPQAPHAASSTPVLSPFMDASPAAAASTNPQPSIPLPKSATRIPTPKFLLNSPPVPSPNAQICRSPLFAPASFTVPQVHRPPDSSPFVSLARTSSSASRPGICL